MKTTRLLFNLIFLYILINSVISIFVKEVKYPEFLSNAVNTDDCGLTFVPIISYIKFSNRCFINFYNNFNPIITIRRQKVMSIESRIFNGEVVNPNEAPWAVAVKQMHHFIFHRPIFAGETIEELREITNRGCGGSLITFEWVITAAHCLPDNSSWWISVSAGLIPGNAWEGRQSRYARLNNFFKHKEFDIGLVKLPQPFTKLMHDGQLIINTICLPQKTEFSNEEEETAVMYGLGLTRSFGGVSNDLVKGTFTIEPYTVCATIRKRYKWNKLLCVNTTVQGSITPCKADSGSGLVQYTSRDKSRAILLGVHKGRIYDGDVPCERNEYSYMNAVSVHIDWILETIRNNT